MHLLSSSRIQYLENSEAKGECITPPIVTIVGKFIMEKKERMGERKRKIKGI